MPREHTEKKPLTPAQEWAGSVGLLLLILAAANLGRAIVALVNLGYLTTLPLTIPLEYLVATSLLWAAALAACGIGLSRFYRWSWAATLVAATLYQVNLWATRLLFDASDFALLGRSRDLLLTALFLAFVWGVLCWPSVRRVFKKEESDAQAESQISE